MGRVGNRMREGRVMRDGGGWREPVVIAVANTTVGVTQYSVGGSTFGCHSRHEHSSRWGGVRRPGVR
jgi:hypothetical protein